LNPVDESSPPPTAAPATAPVTPPAAPAPAAEVVQIASRRAPEPIDVLLARFGARVRAQVSAHCRADQGLDADDVEQEVRIRLWKALERDRNAVLPASYIQRVVVSTVIDQLRRVRARPSEPMPEFDEGEGAASIDSVAPDAEASASERQQVELLGRCLDGLPQRRRQAVELHLQGFTPQEAAGLTGMSAEAVRKLAERGLKDVRARMRLYGIAGDDDE